MTTAIATKPEETVVTATQFRKHLFDYLDRIAAGETIIIQRNNVQVAQVRPIQPTNWRETMRHKIEILVSPEELMQPLDDIWEGIV